MAEGRNRKREGWSEGIHDVGQTGLYGWFIQSKRKEINMNRVEVGQEKDLYKENRCRIHRSASVA